MMKFLLGFFGILAIIAAGIYGFLQTEKFGALPSGERLARIEQSPNYRDGIFQNLQPTIQWTSEESRFSGILNLFKSNPQTRPKMPIPVEKTDLFQLPPDQNLFVWFGHSGYLLQLDGKKYLVDPTLVSASPVSFFGEPMQGADYFKPEHIPPVDVLIISHDHWDHLDFDTVQAIKNRVGKVVTSLGVGAHFERWGWAKNQLIELDWNESAPLFDGVKITALPARHFSGRSLTGQKTLWSSFMLQTPTQTVYLGGDSGSADFYADIAKRFPKITLAILENGQYNEKWANIHTLPAQLPNTVKTLNPAKFVTVHNSKYVLASHPWNEPMIEIAKNAKAQNLPLYTPKIGEVMNVDNDEPNKFSAWWETIE